MCSKVDVPPGTSITECLARLKNINVNIVDFIDAERMGIKVEIWDDFEAFRRYTLQPEHRINREEAKKDGGYLASLLQHLYNPRRKRRRGEKTNDFSSKVASGRVIKKSQLRQKWSTRC
jgi:hypothetical protein